MFKYLRDSFARKKARRVTAKYPTRTDVFTLEKEGRIEFANWENPLTRPFVITQPMISFFRKFIPEGSLAIDIGANIGDTTVPMAIAAGRDGLTLAFDPNPYVFEILKVNSTLNKEKTNIIPNNFAITKEDGEFFYNSSEASFANGGISETANNFHGKYTLQKKIQGINLEKFLNKNYKEWLQKISLIKVDVEGYDLEVLRSIENLIDQFTPVIIAECFIKATKQYKMDMFEFFSAKGYDVFYFVDFDENTVVTKIEAASEMNKNENFNFYAIKRM